MRRTTLAGLVLLPAVLLAGCGGGGSSGGAAGGKAGATAAGQAGSCTYSTGGAAGPAAKQAPVPPAQPDSTGKYSAMLATTQGPVTFDLLADKAPCTVNSFTSLANAHYYDDTPCHRLVVQPSFGVLQCGDPSGTGSGGPGYSFADENLTGATYPAGTVAMANSGPNTNGSQFFLVFSDTQLPPDYTPFGHITSGLDVLSKVAKGGIDGPSGAEPTGDGAPRLPVQLQKVTIAKS